MPNETLLSSKRPPLVGQTLRAAGSQKRKEAWAGDEKASNRIEHIWKTRFSRWEKGMKQLENPYWEQIKDFVSSTGTIPREYADLRWKWCNQYTMAVPDPETVAFVAHYLAPQAIEVGAGTGYWAWLLLQLGIDMVAYDIAPPDRCATNRYHSPYDFVSCTFLGLLRETYAPVSIGGPEVLSQHAERALFLCWPPYRNPMAQRCLENYAGQRLVYLGEGRGDSCATNAFFDRLCKNWREIDAHWPVQWDRMNDKVCVYERKKGTGEGR